MKKVKVEGHYEKVELKMIDCSACGSGYVLYDSRDVVYYQKKSAQEKAALKKRDQEQLKLVGKTCSCGKGELELVHKTWDQYHKGYTIVHCSCGEKVECYNFTNTCDCGNDFNWNGDLLANRSQWGEETGERWSDCY